MILPYRAKNPPEHPPVCTIALIALNTLIFALTSEYFLFIRRSVVESYAVSHETLSLWRLITAMFLHGSMIHLAGNMLFLWIFGASVEGRLRPLPYLAMYMVSGLTGGILSDLFWGAGEPSKFSLGASGAIMGVAGSYLYMFPYSTICVFWRLTFFVRGVADWQARWVVLLYVGLDILFAFLFRGGDGVGHFAHLGGFGAGFLYTFLLRAKRDTEDVSNVQAVLAETKDHTLLSLNELETLTQRPNVDTGIVLAYLEKASLQTGGRADSCYAVLQQHSQALMEKADPNRLAYVLLSLPPTANGPPAAYYLRLAGRLEQIGSHDLAARLYRRIYEIAPSGPDTEVALFRLGQLMERVFSNRSYAQAAYQEMLRLFPEGQMARQARQAMQQR
ncbi:MAG TPA: rhomboid family intramembrane serine protease [Chthonomonadaceae bacterium]|nr:rhomboid family intramembrane serine protease [Chthonomonadaceae bacterium]